MTEKRSDPWLLAEPLVELDIGSLMEPAMQYVVARGHVGLIKVGGTCVLSESLEPNAETGHGRGPLSFNQSSRKPLVRRTQLLQDPTKAQGSICANSNSCVNLTMPALCVCEWDEHGERFKPLRKSVLESEKNDWNHGRIEGAPACLHTCQGMESWEQSTTVAGTFSER